jgi:hypothetical protein
MDTETEICKHLENQTLAWELTHGFGDKAFKNTTMEPLEAVISITFSGNYKRQCIREFKDMVVSPTGLGPENDCAGDDL